MLLESIMMVTSQSPSYLETVQVTASTTSSIHVSWQVGQDSMVNVEGFRVHYQKVASTYIQYGPMLSANSLHYDIQNLVADTYYKVCLVMYRNDTKPIRECVDASTTNWHIPVSIGSSIGAILALAMIVLIVLVSRCPSAVKWRGKQYKKSQKYDSMSSHYHDDHFEFSDTMTHGHEEDLMSDQSESYMYEVGGHRKQDHSRHADKVCNGTRATLTFQQLQCNAGQHMGARPKVYIPTQYCHHHNTHSSSCSSTHHNEIPGQGHHHHHHHHHPMVIQHSLDHGQREDLNHNHHSAPVLFHNDSLTQMQEFDHGDDHIEVMPSNQTVPMAQNQVIMETGPHFSTAGYEMIEIKRNSVVEEPTNVKPVEGSQLAEHTV